MDYCLMCEVPHSPDAPERGIRALVSRRKIPFRRLGSRVVFLRSELEEWARSLPGLSLDELRKRGDSS
jgi:hypothetical protein